MLCSTFAKALAQNGAKVAVLDLTEEKAKVVADEINQEGGTAIGIGGNVLEFESMKMPGILYLKSSVPVTY